MDNVTKYIESGILELYVLGLASADEIAELNAFIKTYPEICNEIDAITESLKLYGIDGVPTPNSSIKTMVLASIDYTQRLKNGEQPSSPALLTEKSKIEDYNDWLNRPDMDLPDELNDIYAKIIGYTPQAMTAIIWIKFSTAAEIHTKEFEKFLIVEGTCDVIIDDKIHQLVPGNYLSIPLFTNHILKVTSDCPCKAILQRVAA